MAAAIYSPSMIPYDMGNAHVDVGREQETDVAAINSRDREDDQSEVSTENANHPLIFDFKFEFPDLAAQIMFLLFLSIASTLGAGLRSKALYSIVKLELGCSKATFRKQILQLEKKNLIMRASKQKYTLIALTKYGFERMNAILKEYDMDREELMRWKAWKDGYSLHLRKTKDPRKGSTKSPNLKQNRLAAGIGMRTLVDDIESL